MIKLATPLHHHCDKSAQSVAEGGNKPSLATLSNKNIQYVYRQRGNMSLKILFNCITRAATIEQHSPQNSTAQLVRRCFQTYVRLYTAAFNPL